MVPVAKAFPTLKFVTQDLPGRQEGFNKAIPSDLKHRFTFQAHNFFEPQPVKHADVYFLRAILHDWPDPDAIRILRQLVSAFKPSSRIVLFDHILNDKDDPTSARMNTVSGVDLEMMAMLGAKERTREEWVDLIKRADERLELKTINHPPGSGLFGIVIGLK
jgi:6-hydroxytryprostatin B O-methyltransferase